MSEIQPWVYAALFVIVAILGLRGSWRLTARYGAVHNQLDEHESWVLRAIAIASWVITVAALYYGFLAVRRLMDMDNIPELVPVSIILAILVLLIPAFFDYVVERVARVPWPNGDDE